MRTLSVRLLLFLLFCSSVGAIHAANFTPLEWQQPVRQHSYSAVVGQRKHTTWIRDQNRNFIDDEIDRRFSRGEAVEIVVNLNRCLTAPQIREAFARYGKITYVSRSVTFFLLSGVKQEDISAIAARPDVAMVEWQTPLQYMNDVSSRAVQSRNSNTYAATAQAAGFNGNGVTIAIMDSGVDDAHETFAGKFVGGFEASNFQDTNGNGIDDSCEGAPLGNGVCTDADDEPANGTTNPPDAIGHGTHVAGIALGAGAPGRVCSAPDDGSAPTNCAGVASGANLLDVRVGAFAPNFAAVPGAIDFIITQRAAFNIHVANLSFGDCTANDGTSAISQQVNYAVAMGIVMVVAAGNAANCGMMPGTQLVGSPPSATFAITTAGTNDQNTVSRAADTNYSSFMRGPRIDFNVMSPNVAALKPDISAPGENIISAQQGTVSGYVSNSGTSMAAPQVSGAAAVMRQALPTADPGSIKHLLKTRADTTLNVATFPAVDPVWDNDLGAGMLNVGNAITAAQADVRFPSCTGASTLPGQACLLTGQPPWNNIFDLSTTAAPAVGVPTTIVAQVRNDGAVAIPVLVNFGVYVFAAGNNQFFHIGTVVVTLAPGVTAVSQNWTPVASDHQCVQVSIDYGLDTNFTNNVTQRNLYVAPSVYELRVENPFFIPARFEIEAKSARGDWRCDVSDKSFAMEATDCPRTVRVVFNAPKGAQVGERADCEVAVWATPADGGKRRLIGGVTVQTYVPKPCRIVGYLRARDGTPAAATKILFEPVRDTNRGFDVEPVTVVVDEEGMFEARMTPDVPYYVTMNNEKQEKQLIVRPRCRQPLYLAAGRDGIVEVTYAPLDEPRIEPRRRRAVR